MRDRISDLRARARAAIDGGESGQGLWTGLFVLVLALVVAAFLLLSGGSGRTPQPAPVLPTATMDAEGAWNPYAEVPGDAGAASRASAGWTPVVRTFVNGFLGASGDPRWLAAVKPVVTPELLARLRHVHRGMVPTGTAGAIRVQASGTYSADLTVPYGAGHALGVRVVDLPKDGRGWLVYSYQNASG